MIYDMPDTTTGQVARRLIDLREQGGAIALGRVLTLVVMTEDGDAESAIEAANEASHEHPCRVIALVVSNRRGSNRLDAQIRIGGDAGASEVIVLRLYGRLAQHGDSVVTPLLLPDAPTVVWWPSNAPENPSEDPVGAMAQRRITDCARARRPVAALEHRARHHAPGDTDLAWSRITHWRGLLAAALDQPPYDPVSSASVTAGSDSPSGDLLVAWLGLYLDCPVERVRARAGSGLTEVRLERTSGTVALVRTDGKVATLDAPGQPQRPVALPARQDEECLAEELRRLDPDDVYGDVVTKGLARLDGGRGGSKNGSRTARRSTATKSTATRSATKATGTKAAGKTAAKKTTATTAAKKTTAKKAPAKKTTAKKAATRTAKKTASAGGR